MKVMIFLFAYVLYRQGSCSALRERVRAPRNVAPTTGRRCSVLVMVIDPMRQHTPVE
ncbi:hypothetical protein [Burkholderia sp. Bp9143]|uniref:hypothetical protein n=1 Tax=Burkholderia sp. Bp9143 TaxID=2184574 RepID=UPI0016274344|nr:hypothetical protein [Burkholderia sp. Bp9143]